MSRLFCVDFKPGLRNVGAWGPREKCGKNCVISKAYVRKLLQINRLQKSLYSRLSRRRLRDRNSASFGVAKAGKQALKRA
jgi:hypothetical protein